MRPVSNLPANFGLDQTSAFEVEVWDTPYSFLEGTAGSLRASAGMQLRVRESSGTAANWLTYSNTWKSSAATDLETAFANSSTSRSTVANGRVPVVQHYWGSGAPNWWGVSTAGTVSVCFSGQLHDPAQRAWLNSGSPVSLTFAVAGSGAVRIVRVPAATGVPVDLYDDGAGNKYMSLTEPRFLEEGFLFTTTASFASTDLIRIYYLQTGTEQWGGLTVKVIAGALSASAAERQAQAAVAPVLGCGLFSQGGTIPGVKIGFARNVEVSHDLGSASRASLELPLLTPTPGLHDGHGWMYHRALTDDPGELRYFDEGALKFTLRRKRLIQIRTFSADANGGATNSLPIFTGFIDDYADVANGTAKLVCTGFEGRMVEQYEQAPDRISYMSRGYRLVDPIRATTAQRGEPVYNIPAFDAWPLAYAVEELAVRAGIDPSRFRRAFQVQGNTGNPTTVAGLAWLSTQVRAFTSNGTLIRLPRPVHYGNAGIAFTESRPFDDAYLFKVEPTKDMWARARELTDRLGYRLRFDENGDVALHPSNNPSHVVDLTAADVTTGSVTSMTDAAAYGATFLQATQAVTITKSVTAARIDVAFPRAASLGSWTVNVKQGTTTVATVNVNPSADLASTQHLFSSTLVNPDANPCVIQVWPLATTKTSAGVGTYTVELIGTGAATRMVDCLLCYVVDPDRTLLPGPLRTDETVLQATATSQVDELRNKVTIVGRRIGLVTDSDKFAASRQPTEQEFVVQNHVDVPSITDPAAKNFVGYPKQSVIYDDSIGDNSYAKYLAKTFIYRQSMPRPGASVETMLLPMLQPGDPLLVTDTKYQTLNQSTIYIKSVTHRFSEKRATTTLVGQPYPDWPSYEPRYDIDLAVFGNQPVTNFDLGYTTLSGHAVSNLNGTVVTNVRDTSFSSTINPGNVVEYNGLTLTGGVLTLPSGAPWPPMPGTLQVRQGTASATGPILNATNTWVNRRYNYGDKLGELMLRPTWVLDSVVMEIIDGLGGSTYGGPYTVGTTPTNTQPFYYKIIGRSVVIFGGQYRDVANNLPYQLTMRVTVRYREFASEVRPDWLGNNPYHDFVSFSYTDAAQPQITLTWKQGDGTSRFGYPAVSWSVRYKSLRPTDPGLTVNPFPVGVAAGSEPVFSPFYDPYTSELGYLVKTSFTVLAEGLYRASIRSTVDGTLVAWLTGGTDSPDEPEKHWEYLNVGTADLYWDGVDQVGEWNIKQSELYATLVDGAFGEDGAQRERVGKGFYVWNQEVAGGDYPPLGYIWLKRDGAGKPIIGHGTYARWYVHVESVTDRLPGTVTITSRGTNDATGRFVFTHLPEPTKLRLRVEDWASAHVYDPNAATGVQAGSVDANWTTAESLNTLAPAANSLYAYINNGRPLRLQFYVEQRPGALWTAANRDELSVKLTRHVHLRAMIGDQVIIDHGVSYPGTSTPKRTVLNRRLTNDEHTNTYPDSGYRLAKTLRHATLNTVGTTEWIFRPADFKREFQYGGLEQSIQFGNYLQLEEIPGWTDGRDLTTERSQMQLALMSYLFYLSVMCTDRSGRTTWGLNTNFVDRSKIVNKTSTDFVTWPDDPMYQIRRTIVCRQWVREPDPQDTSTTLQASKKTWVNTQLTKFGEASAASLLGRLLEHWWWQHDITATTIGTTESNWTSFAMVVDQYSKWLTDNGEFQPKLPEDYETRPRQLGSVTGSTPTSLLTGWNWVSKPLVWVPSITRDLHPYFLLPPMCLPGLDVTSVRDQVTDPLGKVVLEYDLRRWNCYLTTAGTNTEITFDRDMQAKNTSLKNWGDNAEGEVFSSAIWDMTEAATIKKRFFLQTRVDKDLDPCKNTSKYGGVGPNSADYVRQDETVHYEDLRGIFSRTKLPGSGVVKVTPVAPYYINSFRYYGIGSRDAFRNPGYPGFFVQHDTSVGIGRGMYPFRTAFRHEYVWESGSFFPANDRGLERLDAVLWWRTRFLPMAEVGALYYDHGAWTGWKDDVPLAAVGGSPRVLGGLMRSFSSTAVTNWYTPFGAPWMPVASSTVLPTTVELVAHLVLVSERKGS